MSEQSRTATTDYVVEHFHEGLWSRVELRRFPNMLVMVYLRRKATGGWYVKDSIGLPLDNGRSDP